MAGSNPLIELLTPNHYLIDFIELSGIKQEEAIGSLNEKYKKYGPTLWELAAGKTHFRGTIANRMRYSGMVVRKAWKTQVSLTSRRSAFHRRSL